ncbi:gamma conglutin 1-like [Rutidosis leptorrhynchoides]|uniref:gamma conglutin 1-like n=1 Tax=Rutidosis leptorrhynchoides TaxID=125765 RepID=UPI003A9989F4
MAFQQQLVVFIMAFFMYLSTYEHEAIAQWLPSYNSVVTQVTKHTDSTKPLYSINIMTKYVWDDTRHTNFLIDIDAPFIWYDCIPKWDMYQNGCDTNTNCAPPVSCGESQCTDIQTSSSYKQYSSSCPPATNSSTTLPGWDGCTCPVSIVNPIKGSCSEAVLTYGDLMIESPFFVSLHPNALCAPSSSFDSFPKNVSGVVALSTSSYALPSLSVTSGLFRRSFSLCLPSSVSNTGVFFLGTSSYYFFPNSKLDVRSYLSYTPLLNHPDSFGYFIGVKSIVIKKRAINVPANTTTKLSTLEPYTTFRTDIYNQVVRRFLKVTRELTMAKPIAPFDFCYEASANGTTKVGLKVPNIDFSLEDGKNWTVHTANSMKQVTKDVACLAFVDGGATSEHGIVIGTHQMEDNFLTFDLVNSTLGFSSSLLTKGTSCSSFKSIGN